MIDIKEFQKKLGELVSLSKAQEGEMTKEQIQSFFQEEELEEAQVESIRQFLRGQSVGEKESQRAPVAEERKAFPLSEEEESYLREYERSLGQIEPAKPRELEALYQAVEEGKTQALPRLAELYLGQVADLSRELHVQEVFLGDMIQEGNMALMTALNHWEPDGDPGLWLLGEVKKGLQSMIQERDRQRREDDVLVKKVEKLESAVRQLTEDEEEKKFSVEELSVLLNMEVDEIRDVLRLTGDD